MGSRGRTSGAELAVVADGIETRPAAPETLGDLETEIWNAIVSDLPADWFSAGDIPLLVAYCNACSQYEAVTKECRERVDAGDFTQFSAQGGATVRAIFKLQDMLGKQMAMLATKLRLAQSTRYNAKRANTKFEKGTKAKLWAV